MKKILCVIGQLGNGGSEKQLFLFLKYLDQSRYTALVFVTGVEGGIWANRIAEELEVEIKFTGDLSRFKKISVYRETIKQFEPDVIFSWSFFTNMLSFFSSRIPFIGSLRQQYSDENTPGITKRFCLSKKMKSIVVNSQLIMNELLLDRVNPERISVIYNIFESECQQEKQKKKKNDIRGELIAKYGWDNDSIIVMGVGRDSPAKNFALFVDAVAHAMEVVPALKGVIIGSGGDGVRDAVEAKHLSNSIMLTGEVPNAQEWLHGADIFFLSSKEEGMPNVLIEAVNAGCATLATDVGGVRDIYKYLSDDLLEKALLMDFDIDKAAEKLVALAKDGKLRTEITELNSEFLNELKPEVIMKKYIAALGV